jgi:hypothetical protein
MPLPSCLYASAGIPTHARSLLTAVAPEPRRKAGGKTQAQAGGRLSPLFSASRNRRRRGCGKLWKTRGPGGWAFSKGCGKMAEEAEDASFPQTGSFHSPGRNSPPGLSERVIHPQILRKTHLVLLKHNSREVKASSLQEGQSP